MPCQTPKFEFSLLFFRKVNFRHGCVGRQSFFFLQTLNLWVFDMIIMPSSSPPAPLVVDTESFFCCYVLCAFCTPTTPCWVLKYFIYFWLKRWNLVRSCSSSSWFTCKCWPHRVDSRRHLSKHKGSCLAVSVGKAVAFSSGLCPDLCMLHEHLTLQDLRSKISVLNECLKILLVKAVLFCKTVELCIHLVMLLLASQWLSAPLNFGH